MKTFLFGAGKRCEKLLLKYSARCFDGIFDNCKNGSILGLKLERPYYKKELFIVVTIDSNEVYLQIRKQLIGLGYKEFEDFIPYQLYKKKVAIAYGNCHMDTIKQYLESSKQFNKIYGFYPLPTIQSLNSLDIQNIIPNADIIFHQSIRDDNSYGREYGSKKVLKYAKKSCEVVSVPNLYGLPKCFFPQLLKQPKKRALMHHLTIADDYKIIEWYESGFRLDEIVCKIQSQGSIDCTLIKEMWEEFLTKLFDRESDWDIKISDYILNHYQTEKLFYEPWHISTELAREIANRILIKFEMPMISTLIPCLDDYEVFIYEDVKQALGLKFKEEQIRKHTRLTSCMELQAMDLVDYVDLCIKTYDYSKYAQELDE